MALVKKTKIKAGVKTKVVKKKITKTNKISNVKKKTVNKKKAVFATGRRKTSVARVILTSGKGIIKINGKNLNQYVLNKYLINDLMKPLKLTSNDTKYNIDVNVFGGGFSSQVGAICLGIARALVNVGIDRKILKGFGLLTRDSRMKERKKYGLKAARKAPQFSKR